MCAESPRRTRFTCGEGLATLGICRDGIEWDGMSDTHENSDKLSQRRRVHRLLRLFYVVRGLVRVSLSSVCGDGLLWRHQTSVPSMIQP